MERRPKRTSSFQLIELAPKICKCEVVDQLQKRFVASFHDKAGVQMEQLDTHALIHATTLQAEYEKSIREKLHRYEQLANDMRRAVDTSGDLKIISKEGASVAVHEAILRVRTPKLLAKKDKTQSTIKLDESIQVIRNWVTYVYTAAVEWYIYEEEGIKRLAEAFGPEGLVEVCRRQAKKWEASASTSANPNPDSGPASISISVSSAPEPDSFAPTLNFSSSFSTPVFIRATSAPSTSISHSGAGNPSYDNAKVASNPPGDNQSEAKRNPPIQITHDSFFDDEPIFVKDTNNDKVNKNMDSNLPRELEEIDDEEIVPLYTSTPRNLATSTQKPVQKLKFPSNVKILKVGDGVTPMPNYEQMDPDNLNLELAKYGLRPKVPKKARAALKKIYEQLHPVIDPSTPTARPLKPLFEENDETPKAKVGKEKKKPVEPIPVGSKHNSEREKMSKGAKRSSSSSSVADNSSKVSKDPWNEIQLDSTGSDEDPLARNDGDEEYDDLDDGPADRTGIEVDALVDDGGILAKDLASMQTALTCWLKKSENADLYLKVLDQTPIPLEEFLNRTAAADCSVCGITKKAMPSLLDSLGITFALPQNGQGGMRLPAMARRRVGRV